MFGRRLASAGILLSVVASLLVLGIVAAEVPELLSLVDNTSNDFMVRKIGRAECSRPLTVASHGSLWPDPKNFACETTAFSAATLVGAELISFDFLALHSVLRR
jgi:hypothetical protein